MNKTLGLVVLAALSLMPSSLTAEVVREEIIIVKKNQPEEPDRGRVVVIAPTPESVRPGTSTDAILNHPDQAYIDSDAGPMPLFTDVVVDPQTGKVVPRFPSYYEKRLLENPTRENALLYLEHNKARVRRGKEVTNLVERTAMENGYITPSDFTINKNLDERADAQALWFPGEFNSSKLGKPIFSKEQALRNGMDPDDIPLAPRSMADLEFWYFWDVRKKVSHNPLLDFAEFGSPIMDIGGNGSDAVVKSINLDNDVNAWNAQINFLNHKDTKIKRIENHIDHTNLRNSMKISVVPTYMFIDARRGKLLRLEGPKSVKELQMAMFEFLGIEKDAQTWPPKPEWFMTPDKYRKYMAATGERVAFVPPPSEIKRLPNVEETENPSQPIMPWNPSRNR